MTFMDFFLYSTITNLIYLFLFTIYSVAKAWYLNRKLQNLIKSGQIKLMSLDDLEEQLTFGDKKTWN